MPAYWRALACQPIRCFSSHLGAVCTVPAPWALSLTMLEVYNDFFYTLTCFLCTALQLISTFGGMGGGAGNRRWGGGGGGFGGAGGGFTGSNSIPLGGGRGGF